MKSEKVLMWLMIGMAGAGVLIVLPGLVISAPFFLAAIRIADYLGEVAR